jgi:acyl-coenzyme A synthetase/AMP-(fatty) acid ligase
MAAVLDRLAACARAMPEALALSVAGGSSLCFGQWRRDSHELSRALAGRGVQPGDRVGLAYDGRAWCEYAIAFFGVIGAGAVAVPISLELAPATRERMLGESRCVGLLESHPTSGRGGGERWAASVPDALGWSERADPISPRGDQDALIVMTSGSTGGGSAVTACHDNLAAELSDRPPRPSEARAVYLHSFDPTFNTGIALLVEPLSLHFELVALPAFDPDLFATVAAARSVTATMLTPFTARRLLLSDALERHDLAALRHLTLTGADATPELLAELQEALPAVTIHNAYATTEAYPAGTSMVYDRTRPRALGEADPGCVRIVDADGHELPPGVNGYIELRTPGLAPRVTAGRPATRDGWVATRDVGRVEDDGCLYLVDRGADVLEVDGQLVSTLAVEAAVRAQVPVIDAAVYGFETRDGPRLAVAVVGLEAVDEQFVRDVASHVPGAAGLIARIEQLDAIPRNPSGKVMKQRLREGHAA